MIPVKLSTLVTHITTNYLNTMVKFDKTVFMNIGVLGTGVVGETIATALVKRGHNVRMGSRTPDNEKAMAWVNAANEHATQGVFNDAAAFGEIVFLCLNGAHTLDAIKQLEPESLEGKIVIDLTNPLDFSHGMPPRLLDGLGNSNSLGEEVQKALPQAHVVKTLNTMNCQLMVDPKLVNNGRHTLFICGNDEEAKSRVKDFLEDNFGWNEENILDLGPIQNARATEAYVPFWVAMMQATGTPMFNVHVVR
jgi:predicted dinucleotide-binding enzyme